MQYKHNSPCKNNCNFFFKAMSILFHVFQHTMIYLLKKRNKTHHASKAVAFNILLFNKIILKNCGIILPSPDKHKFWSNTSLLLKLVYHVSQQA